MSRASLILRAVFAVTLLAAAPPARSMTVVATDFDRLIDRAESIYRARIVSVTAGWSGEGVNRHIATFITLNVEESYRGGMAGRQTLELFGGHIGERYQRIAGMPEFRPGDTEILFVRGNRRDLCPLVGLHHGRLRVVKNAADGREQIFLHDGTPLTGVTQIGSSGESARPAATASGALTSQALGDLIRSALQQRGIKPDGR